MEDTIFKILTESRIYFCEEEKDPLTTSARAMMSCFDVFIFDDGWLFYRLKEDCYDRGYLDEDEYLIGPCDGYDNMICMAKLFEGTTPVDYVESPSWIEEEDFHYNRKRGTLNHLIEEMCKIDNADRDSSGDIKIDHESEEYKRPESPVLSHSRSFDKSNSSKSDKSESDKSDHNNSGLLEHHESDSSRSDKSEHTKPEHNKSGLLEHHESDQSDQSDTSSSSSHRSHHSEDQGEVYEETGNFEHGFSSDEDSEESLDQ